MFAATLVPTIAVFALDLTTESEDEFFLLLLLVGLLAFVVFLVGVRFIDRGRRMRAIPAVDLLRKDTRAPVLFLRSFEDDDLSHPAQRLVPMRDMFQRRYEESLRGCRGCPPIM